MNHLTQRKLSFLVIIAIVLASSSFIYVKKSTGTKKTEDPNTLAGVRQAIVSTMDQPAKKFSAVRALDDLHMARDRNQDFLTIYLSKDFPETVSDADLVMLHNELAGLEKRGSSPSINYKRGMDYFFLALSETLMTAQGNSIDPAVVYSHWKSCLANLRKCGDLEPFMALEVERILRESDRDGNQSLSHDEIVSIITTHNLYSQ